LVWTIEYNPKVKEQLKRLDKASARRIVDFLEERLALRDDPRSLGQALKGITFANLWKYRVGDYRVIVNIEDRALKILVVRVGDRKAVYKNHR